MMKHIIAKNFVLLLLTLLFVSESLAAPTCQYNESDPDGDGWGWENYRSCKVTDSSISKKTSSNTNYKAEDEDDARYPTCKSTASDSDGDGWGYENYGACRVRGETSQATDSSTKTNTSESNNDFSKYPTCKNSSSDSDGDGWGWENHGVCKVRAATSKPSTGSIPSTSFATVRNPVNNTRVKDDGNSRFPTCKLKSSDPDGDGWGWENHAVCYVRADSAEQEVTSETIVEEVVSEINTIDRTPSNNNIIQDNAANVTEPESYAKISPPSESPVEKYGKLRVCGNKLCAEDGRTEVQLTGMSSHGIHWYGWDYCIGDRTMDMMAYEWGNSLFRIAMYVTEGKWSQPAYTDNPSKNIENVNKFIDEVSERGMYALVDFHILKPGQPLRYTNQAIEFFTAIATRNKGRKNLIYEIANEPNNTSWSNIKNYAEQVIPAIRRIDPEAVIIVGTEDWSSFGRAFGSDNSYERVTNNPLNFDNIMYAFHFYALEHQQKYLDTMDRVSDELPIFVTEWGSTDASGQHGHDKNWADKYVNLMKDKKISWAYWNFSSDHGSSSIWKHEYCGQNNKNWEEYNMKDTGKYIKRVFQNSK